MNISIGSDLIVRLGESEATLPRNFYRKERNTRKWNPPGARTQEPIGFRDGLAATGPPTAA